ncbi:MAG: hypothetical protein ACLSXK_04715 [Lactococcus petauri]
MSKDDVKRIIEEFGTIELEEMKNPSAGLTRYTIFKDDTSFKFDVWFKKSGKIRVASVGNDELGNQLKEIFISQSRYAEIIGTDFSTKVSEKLFNDLIEYLSKGVPNMTVGTLQDKGNNGLIYKISTNFGDVATITYWKSTRNFRFQGYMMSIYAEVRSFILPQLSETVESTLNLVTTNLVDIDAASEKFISTLVPTYFSKANSHIQGLLQDSSKMLFLFKDQNVVLSDYAPVTMSGLKVIEYRIKEICLGCGIIVNDKKGFVIDKKHPSNQFGKNISVFEALDNSGNGRKKINSNVGIPAKYSQILVDLYEYQDQNRNTTFHLKQQIFASRKIETLEEAHDILTRTFKLLEQSYI